MIRQTSTMPVIETARQCNYFCARCNQYTVRGRKLCKAEKTNTTNKSRTVNSLFHHSSPPSCFSLMTVSAVAPYTISSVAYLTLATFELAVTSRTLVSHFGTLWDGSQLRGSAVAWTVIVTDHRS